jgi:hypothetical protein
LETLLGIIIGIVSTVIVSHYYFRRSVNKRLSIYALMSNRVFSGIDATVRSHLKFLFHGKEISELQQVELIVANDGERAISNCIQPLRLQLPTSIKILDASILHKSPKELEVSMIQGNSEAAGYFLEFDFPLLNKSDFFLVKLLLDGKLPLREMHFQIQADELPRSLKPEWLPDGATSTSERKVEWAGVIAGFIFFACCATVAFITYAYYQSVPSAFPWPWESFRYLWPNTVILIAAIVVSAIIGFIGAVMFIGMGFENFLKRNPKFPLPEELRGSGYTLFSHRLADFDDTIEDSAKVPAVIRN